MCTNFLVKAVERTGNTVNTVAVINGRSMEFGSELKSKVILRASNVPMVLDMDCGDPLSFTPLYNYVGLTSFELPICSDGMNSEGLSVGALWLPGSQYQKLEGSAAKHKILFALFADWMLGSYKNVDEVADALNHGDVCVYGGELAEKYIPLHFAVQDASGRSIVIEFLNHKAVVSENPVAVLTNNPPFPWHLTNLQNYVSVTSENPKPIMIGDLEVGPTGQGNGLAALPGDSSPPSRFVRTAYLRQFALEVATAEEAKSLAFHLLNAVDIVRGSVSSTKEPTAKEPAAKTEYDYTQWVVVKDLTNKTLTVRTYASPLAFEIDLETDISKNIFAKNSGKQFVIPTTFSIPFPLDA